MKTFKNQKVKVFSVIRISQTTTEQIEKCNIFIQVTTKTIKAQQRYSPLNDSKEKHE